MFLGGNDSRCSPYRSIVSSAAGDEEVAAVERIGLLTRIETEQAQCQQTRMMGVNAHVGHYHDVRCLGGGLVPTKLTRSRTWGIESGELCTRLDISRS